MKISHKLFAIVSLALFTIWGLGFYLVGESEHLMREAFDSYSSEDGVVAAGDPAEPDAQIERPVAELRARMLLAAAVATTIVLLLAGPTTRSLSRRVHQLSDATRALARGDFEKIRLKGHDELSKLACAIDRMASEIAARSADLRTKNRMLEKEIRVRTKMEGERQRMEVELRHAQKLESIGQLAAGIAHEINTPAQYVGDNTRFLRDAFSDLLTAIQAWDPVLETDSDRELVIEKIDNISATMKKADVAYLRDEIPLAIEQSLEGIQRISKIVCAMKEFAHPGCEELSATDLNRALESTITVARNEWKYVAEMDTDLDAQLPEVPCLPGEMNQVFLNIITNAAHAIKDARDPQATELGKIRVKTARDGDFAEIRISDTGTGIPEKIRGRIFDPFFTTKEVGQGSGQGLAIAHDVVTTKHGGTLEFETAEGEGTTFVIRLPIEPAAATA